MPIRAPKTPTEKTATDRDRLRQALGPVPQTARTLSVEVGLTERDVLAHLEHLERSLKAEGTPLQIAPARCKKCGFRFERRERLTAPSRCPKCRAERIHPPAFGL